MKTKPFLLLCLFNLLLVGCKKNDCPGDAVKWTNGHCYEAVLAAGLSWHEAKAACEQRGGYLATITSEQENTFVFNLVKSNNDFWYLDYLGNGLGPWLGGFQPDGSQEPDGGWEWITSEPFSYTNWETGQPDNATQFGQSVIRFIKIGGLIGDGWDDSDVNNPAEHRKGYICEYD
ncbi:MAG: C-type lectin domain-containing protein [Bacteroidales bacterium]|nr:C-type lectin domain-containing protein [Bacteroidales bacterium]